MKSSFVLVLSAGILTACSSQSQQTRTLMDAAWVEPPSSMDEEDEFMDAGWNSTESWDGGFWGHEGMSPDSSADAASHSLSAGSVIITEIMPNPKGADSAGEWLELHNSSAEEGHNVKGCTLSDADSAVHTITSDLIVPPDGYVTVSRSASPGFTPNHVLPGFTLENSEDQVILRCGSTEIDRVEYSMGFPLTEGASMSLSATVLGSAPETQNDNAANWCSAVALYDGTNKGTPGHPNGSCEANE